MRRRRAQVTTSKSARSRRNSGTRSASASYFSDRDFAQRLPAADPEPPPDSAPAAAACISSVRMRTRASKSTLVPSRDASTSPGPGGTGVSQNRLDWNAAVEVWRIASGRSISPSKPVGAPGERPTTRFIM